METRDITMERQAVVAALKLSDPDSRTFHKFIRFSPFSSGGGGNGEDWQIGVPYFLDDLLLEDDLHRYIENWALKDYDPNLPSAHAERAVYLGSKQRASEPQQNLATRLHALLVNHEGLGRASEFLQSEGVDWTEADQTYVSSFEAWMATVDSVLDLADRSEVEIWRKQRERNGRVTLLNVHDQADRMRVVLEGIQAKIARSGIDVMADSGSSDTPSSASGPVAYHKNNPWISGSFYLVCFVALGTFLLIAAKLLPWTILPLVVFAWVLAVAILGAFQLRNDERLSEKGFLELVAMTFKRLPLIRGRDK